MPLVPAHQPQPARQPGPAQPGATGGGGFETLHPRGRGGKWIAKPGDGTGASGPDTTTAQLQQRLKQLGFNVPQNGQYDAATAAAVASFQTRYGLDPHGGIDAATMALLQNPPPQTLAQTQKALGLTAKGTAKSAASTSLSAKQRTAANKARITPASLGSGTLKSGQSGQEVSTLQKALVQAGYTAPQDGKFGTGTETAVQTLQAHHGLPVTGVADAATKALLVGLDWSHTSSKTKASSASNAVALLPGEVATLRTAQPKARHGSRTAGSRMKLKPPAKAPTTLKYHAEHEEIAVPKIKRLQEGTWIGGNGTDNTSTVAFGTGGQPSMSIKDGRDTTPLADQPVWTRTGVLVSPPDTTIQDGRAPAPPTPSSGADLAIPDGRRFDQIMTMLNEAMQARKAAATGDEFTRALARERVLRERLSEAGLWTEGLHPRGRGGKWIGRLGGSDAPKTGPRHAEIAKAVEALKPGEYLQSYRGGNPHSYIRKERDSLTDTDKRYGRNLLTAGSDIDVGTNDVTDAVKQAHGAGTDGEDWGDLRPLSSRDETPPHPPWETPEQHAAYDRANDESTLHQISLRNPETHSGSDPAWYDENDLKRLKAHGEASNDPVHQKAAKMITAELAKMDQPAPKRIGKHAYEKHGRYTIREEPSKHGGSSNFNVYKGGRHIGSSYNYTVESARRDMNADAKATKTLVASGDRLEEAIGPIKKGAFHAWLGKPLDQPITDADIAKGLASKDPHARRMAHFARVSRGWGGNAKKKTA